MRNAAWNGSFPGRYVILITVPPHVALVGQPEDHPLQVSPVERNMVRALANFRHDLVNNIAVDELVDLLIR